MATKKASARPVKRTKAEVEKAFDEIREEVESSRGEVTPKQQELTLLRQAAVRDAAEGVTVENVVQRISTLGLDVSKALSGLSEQMSEEVQRLTSIREAVELERAELDRLHKIDVASTALDQLVQEHGRVKAEFEQEVATGRAEWEETARNTERERKEQDELLRKQRQREIDDYEYKKTLERKKAQDKYDEDQRQLERKNTERQQELEKSWTLRTAALKEQEDELKRLRTEAEQFPARLKDETARAAAEARAQTEAQFEYRNELLKRESESDKRLAELRIKTLEDVVAQQTVYMASLQKQLDDAKQQVQDIAVKAIEGASGARTLSHVNQIAMEQAKNRPQS